jgi:ATP-binding cassette, subfamily G (WHITE), member 2
MKLSRNKTLASLSLIIIVVSLITRALGSSADQERFKRLRGSGAFDAEKDSKTKTVSNAYKEEDVRKQCSRAFVSNDPACKFQTTYFSVNSSHPENCAHCVERNIGRGLFHGSKENRAKAEAEAYEYYEADVGDDDDDDKDDWGERCPVGWSGVDCSVCDLVNACPSIVVDGRERDAVGCTSECFLPTFEELNVPRRTMDLEIDKNRFVPEATYEAGKVFSCSCGGDAKTDPYCSFQKDLSFLFHILAPLTTTTTSSDDSNNNGSVFIKENVESSKKLKTTTKQTTTTTNREVEITVRAYGGMPTQDNADYPEWKYKYASAAVWDANFTKCTYSVQKCRAPYPEDHTCVAYDCTAGKTACPPSDVEKCPGRSAMKCGTNETDNTTDTLYWQHPCNPLVTPVNDRGMQFWCDMNATKTGDGGNVCYWTQPGVIPTLAVTCRIGNCVYDEQTMAKENWCSLEETPPVYWTGDGLTKVFMFLFVALIVGGMWVYVLTERKQRYNEEIEQDEIEVDEDLNTEALLNDSAAYSDDGYSSVNDDDESKEDDDDVVEEGERSAEKEKKIHRKTSSSLTPSTSHRKSSDGKKVMMTLSWRHLFVDATVKHNGRKSQKRILGDVSGMAGPGGIFAVLGPSGAGKSTLIDTLAGRTTRDKNVRGAIYLDGQVATNNGLRAASACVTQDDVLPGTSTVWEHLLFHATLRMPRETSKNALRRRVGQTMRDLGIEKLADSLIGDQFSRGLSGGEKRRVSIATELLMSPGIMFLDEPTTGLDSTNAAKVVDILSKLGSRHGVTVMLSIHQPRPDIFRLLDRILILSSVGSVVYSGPSNSAKNFFESLAYIPTRPRDVHVADFILDVVIKSSKETVSRISRDFAVSDIFTLNERTIEMLATEASSDETTEDEEKGSRQGKQKNSAKEKHLAPMKIQIQQLTGRLRKNAIRHPFLIGTHFIATLLTAIALGAIFFQCARDTGGVQNRMGCCFFILLYLTLMSLSSLPVWREDDLLSTREIAAGAYDVDGYFVSQIAFDVIVIRAIPPLFFSLATYFCVGLHLDFFSFINFTFVCVLTNIAASALCTCVSIVTPSNASANVVGMLLLLVNVVCGGFLLNQEQPRSKASSDGGDRHILVKICTRLSFVNHGFQAMMIGEFLDAGTFYFTPKLVESDPTKKGASSDGGDVRVPVSGKEVLDFFSFGSTKTEMRAHVATLAALAVAYLLLAYILLKLRFR